jgi:predicted signal transduction protein with EAL and GGDEF domain
VRRDTQGGARRTAKPGTHGSRIAAWSRPPTSSGWTKAIGLVVPIGEWIIRLPRRDATTWPAHRSVAANVSPAQFKHGPLEGCADVPGDLINRPVPAGPPEPRVLLKG